MNFIKCLETNKLAPQGYGSTMVRTEPVLGVSPSTVKTTLKGEIIWNYAAEEEET